MTTSSDLFCPVCGTKTVIERGGIWYERCQWTGKVYADEASVAAYQCTTCVDDFAILRSTGTDPFPASFAEMLDRLKGLYHGGRMPIEAHAAMLNALTPFEGAIDVDDLYTDLERVTTLMQVEEVLGQFANNSPQLVEAIVNAIVAARSN